MIMIEEGRLWNPDTALRPKNNHDETLTIFSKYYVPSILIE